VPVQGMPGGTAVVRAYAAPSLPNRGVNRTWLILAALGAALFAVGLILADRLGRRLTTAVSALAGTADRLAAGDLEARVTPDGPNEIRRVGEELNRLASRIGELLTAEREEVADLAHRLRTPVAALRLDADSIRSDVDRDRVGADVDYLTRVVDEVIRTARRTVREGAGASADLAAVARDRVAFWTPLAEDDGRALTLAAPDRPVLVRVATEDLATALDGLLQNVFAHTADGVNATVNITADGVLTVADTGGGFNDVPERGVSAVSTGLGLDIARRTAEASGGGMTIGRSPAGGAEVTLTFGLVDGRP
jgi:signal transduction histidine kinase